MIKAAVRRNRKDGVVAMLRGLLRDPGSVDELAGIRAPTLLLGGAEDRFAPPEVLRTLQQHIAGAQLRIIAECGHTVAIEQPDAFFAAVHAFLSR